MAKSTTIIEGDASPLPIFSRELAFRVLDQDEEEAYDLVATITTASFGSSGSLEGVRSFWLVNDETKNGALHMEMPRRFSGEHMKTGDYTEFKKSMIFSIGWSVIEHEKIPATHRAILAEWLRARWKMDKLRGRIT